MIHPIYLELQQLGLLDVADDVYGSTHAARFSDDLKNIVPGLQRFSEILEIAPYTGWVSIQLRKMGYAVSIVQSEHDQRRFQKRFDHYGITSRTALFPSERIPYPPESFDMVIFCEILEHFSFNPVPTLLQIRDVLKPDGLLYLTTPNQATLRNALKLVAGRPINESMSSFITIPDHATYDPEAHLNYGLHWREYTMGELCALLQATGFRIRTRRFRMYPVQQGNRGGLARDMLRRLYRSLYHMWPAGVGAVLEVVAFREPAAA